MGGLIITLGALDRLRVNGSLVCFPLPRKGISIGHCHVVRAPGRRRAVRIMGDADLVEFSKTGQEFKVIAVGDAG